MLKPAILALMIGTTPSVAQPVRPEIYYGAPRIIAGPRQPGRPPIPYGAGTPRGEVAYPLAPGHIQAPPSMRHAFPRGIPPGWLE